MPVVSALLGAKAGLCIGFFGVRMPRRATLERQCIKRIQQGTRGRASKEFTLKGLL